MTDEKKRAELRARRLLHKILSRKILAALRKFERAADILAAKQALGESYWIGDSAQFPDLQELKLANINEQDPGYPGEN